MTPTGKSSPHASARLFSEAHPAAPPAGVHVANIDGASRGNPGPASYAVILRDPEGDVILELGKHLGRQTNNVAEYYALLAALDYASNHRIQALRIRSDSELLVRQMQGRYKVKSAELKPLHERASKLARQLEYFAIEHVRRESNREADALANLALDSGGFGSTAGTPVGSLPAATAGHGSGDRAQSARVRKVRATFAGGVLVPAEAVDLPEGSEVLLEIRIPKP